MKEKVDSTIMGRNSLGFSGVYWYGEALIASKMLSEELNSTIQVHIIRLSKDYSD